MKKKRTRNYKKEGKWQASPKQRAYRAELNREARKRKIYGKRKSRGVELSHTSSGKMVLESASTNRSRNGKNGKSTLKKVSFRRGGL